MTKNKAKPKAKKASKPSAKPKAKKPAKSATAKAPAPKKAEKANSKAAIIYNALKQKDGATIEELAKLTSWQNHSVRGFLSTIRSKDKEHTLDKFTRSDSGKTAFKLAAKSNADKN